MLGGEWAWTNTQGTVGPLGAEHLQKRAPLLPRQGFGPGQQHVPSDVGQEVPYTYRMRTEEVILDQMPPWNPSNDSLLYEKTPKCLAASS